MTSGTSAWGSQCGGFSDPFWGVVSRASSLNWPASPAIKSGSGCFILTVMYLTDRETSPLSEASAGRGERGNGRKKSQVSKADNAIPRKAVTAATIHSNHTSRREVRMRAILTNRQMNRHSDSVDRPTTSNGPAAPRLEEPGKTYLSFVSGVKPNTRDFKRETAILVSIIHKFPKSAIQKCASTGRMWPSLPATAGMLILKLNYRLPEFIGPPRPL